MPGHGVVSATSFFSLKNLSAKKVPSLTLVNSSLTPASLSMTYGSAFVPVPVHWDAVSYVAPRDAT